MPRPLGAIAFARQPHHLRQMVKRATTPSEKFEKPAHWSNEPPPEPEPAKVDEKLSPTRYGDWVKDGIAIDF